MSDTIRTTAWKKQKNQDEPSGSESTSTEATSIVAVDSDRNTTKLDADRIKGFLPLVAEAGSIVLHVSNDMSEEEIDGEEAGETAAAKDTEEISRKEPNSVILCQACFSTWFYRKYWNTTSRAGKRKREWEFT